MSIESFAEKTMKFQKNSNKLHICMQKRRCSNRTDKRLREKCAVMRENCSKENPCRQQKTRCNATGLAAIV